MSNEINEVAVVSGLRDLHIDLMRTSNQFRRDGDGMLAELYRADSKDVFDMRMSFQETGDFGQLVRSTMNMDTAIRERVLEALKAAVGAEVIEATGLMEFI